MPHYSKFSIHSLLLIFLLSCSARVFSEPASPYYESPYLNPVLEYLITSGRLSVPHVLHQPFTSHEVLQGIADYDGHAGDRHAIAWMRLLSRDVMRYYRPGMGNEESGQWYLGSQARYRLFQDEEKNYSRYRVGLRGTYTLPYLVLANHLATDQAFATDPLYHGDTGEWIQGRSESGYALVKYKGFSALAGRLYRNWGTLGEYSAFLSDYPYSYDQVAMQVSTRQFRFSFMTTRLNDMMAINTQAQNPLYQESRRYLAVQRGDLALTDNLHIGLNQAAVYGGPGETLRFSKLNPMGLFYIVQRNTGEQISGLWALDFWWKPSPQLTLTGQWLIDDVIVNNEPGQDDRAVHDDRFGIVSRAVVTDPGVPGLQLAFTWVRVWNWTYMSYRSWENYLYFNKSLGYPLNSYEKFALAFDYFGAPPLLFQAQIGFDRHGEQNLLQPFGDTVETFPRGTVQESLWIDAGVTIYPSAHLWAKLRFYYRTIDKSSSVGQAEVLLPYDRQ